MPSFVTVATFSNPLEAHVLKTKLESEGIEVFLRDEHIVGTNWLYSNAVGGVKLQVPAEDAARARAIIGNAPPPGVPSCPECQGVEIYRTELRDWPAVLLSILLLLPPPGRRISWRCRSCGHDW